MGHRWVDPRLSGFARTMRKSLTDAELRLWLRLRNRGLSGHKFRRQVPIGPFIADFVCAEARLVVEIDGSQHFEDVSLFADARRTAWLEAEGYRVLRFNNPDVLQNIDGVYRMIEEALAEVRNRP